MDGAIFPEIFQGLNVKAFFTDKSTRIDVRHPYPIMGKRVYLPIQKHTDRVIILSDDLASEAGDAVVTNREDVFIGVQTADCAPILLYDKRHSVIAAVHAGWRGTAKGILKSVIDIHKKVFSSHGEDILMAIGPSIRDCCYNVGNEVVHEVERVTGEGDYLKNRQNQWFVDLALANKIQALSLGLKEEHIWISKECTSCQFRRFYSYRKDKTVTERQGGFIGIDNRRSYV